ncbi:hypothetical protein PR202_gb04425 [Eleusine coracana subsp. coracana]|uniref:NAC domain-containing protein n=1 Tax=Eleusine coracana subsp. coracana TaxID=191504 RepID=A0AAV5E5B9_ELECO|nr:hypothetical protein PR202_gb04425 [Eleusine coracana subsp. coracana]
MAMAAAAEGSGRRDAEAELNLPPGFRFHPTDEELVVHYLCRKVARQQLPVAIIAEVDLYKFDPWDLPEGAVRAQGVVLLHAAGPQVPQRVATQPRRWERVLEGHRSRQADRAPKGSAKVAGIKKALVFYSGKAPRGVKTDWIMHEYRLAEADRAPGKKGSQKLDEWVLCRLYNKKNNWEKVKVEELQEAAPHPDHRQNGEVMDALTDTMSDSFQTHDSEIDNATGMQNSFGDMAQGQATMPNGGMVTVKEDTTTAGFGQNGYLQSISAPQMRMWQTILPPF